MKVLFLGDLFVGGDMLNYPPNSKFIVSKSFDDADLVVANLEQVISDSDKVAEKGVIAAPAKAINYLARLGIDCVCLAQNHIHDKLNTGIADTLTYLQSINMGHFGAGSNLNEAEKPFILRDNYYVIGGCSYNSYPRQVQFATQSNPGVNPINVKRIKEQLVELPDDAQVILFFHWGREYVRFPNSRLIELAKELLSLDKVALVIGGHAHVFQGDLTHNKKKAFLSLGNFLFPNFYMNAPLKIYYPSLPLKVTTMRGFYGSNNLSYKKWKVVNRISLGVLFNTHTKDTRLIPYFQLDNCPFVKEMSPPYSYIVLFYARLLSIAYTLPTFIYDFVVRINELYDYLSRKIGKTGFKTRSFLEKSRLLKTN